MSADSIRRWRGVREEGGFYPQDPEGFLVNPMSVEKVREPWASAVDQARALTEDHFGDRLHSLYLRGSVARGFARAGVSDLDLIVVLRGDVEHRDRAWWGALDSTIVARFPFIKKVDLALTPLEHTSYKPVQFGLKVKALFLAGVDLRPSLPRFRPTDGAAVQYARALGWDVGKCLVLLQSNLDAEESGSLREWIGKRLVRAGFELVMADVNGYTTDLYPSYRAFAVRFPDHDAAMGRALELAVGSNASLQEVEELVIDFGLRLCATVDHAFGLSRREHAIDLDREAKEPPTGPGLSAVDWLHRPGDTSPRLRVISTQGGAPLLSLHMDRLRFRAPPPYLGLLVGICCAGRTFSVRDALAWGRPIHPTKVNRLLSSLVRCGSLLRTASID